MSLHTKVIFGLAVMACLATTLMVSIAIEPDITPTFAVKLAPIGAWLMGGSLVSFLIDRVRMK